MNVTSTGIAVGIAVVVALGLLFFGPQLFALVQHQSLTASSTAISMQENTQQPENSMNSSNTPASTPAPSIPQNVTQLMSSDQVVGTGAVAQPGDQVTVQYVGELTNGQVFDASSEHGTQGFTFTLGAGQVIKGWDEGVVGMKVGGKRELVIPQDLGYGETGSPPDIPPKTGLKFDVELLGLNPVDGAASAPPTSPDPPPFDPDP